MKLDKKTIEKIKNNDYDTIESIYSTYYKLVKYIIFQKIQNHNDADDLVQEVFLKVFRKIDTYNPNYKFNNWISEIARNTALDYIKKKQNYDYELLKDDAIIIDDTQNSEHNSINDSLDEKIKSILNDDEYQIVTYRIYFDFKFKDIAKMLDSNVSIVSSKYFRAINKLKKKIRKEDFYE